MNGYNIVSEILMSKPQPNVDMLITKPSLYFYIKKSDVDYAKKIGVKCDEDNVIHCYFSRVPQSIENYRNFLNDHVCVRIQISKIEKIKDQKVRLVPVNIPNKTKDLTKDDILDLVKNNSTFYKYFKDGVPVEKIPHCDIQLSGGVLPSFSYKILE